MAKAPFKTENEMSDILRHLHMQRESILNKWRSTCAENLAMLSKTSFSREEFNDQVPAILNILNQRLAKLPEESEVVIVAQEHGLHRWQRGYSLPELLVELEVLFNILMETINQFHKEQGISADVLLEIYQH
ncbi:RsbRD N-terminal domain-containing protein [Dyadobacter sp. CY323]|uniref:RsbRD N-terminal domain-containing protein n=1 Tax=Dyadobacter sp. CY323 TaxID=2907302 RepID=UPI001F2B10C3|nr:RsbRD N-terminal domain-containing protein [Dyadobacter sp. CY323]MCE6989577.1 RsbRD N-terminal domain-containing protein [Dyadobacter sp. CY323]